NTNSDSEVLLNVLAHELEHINGKKELTSASIFQAVSQVHKRCQGAYAVLVLIAGAGLLAFRDPYGIRPLIVGRQVSSAGVAYMVASESVALDIAGFELMRDVAPGEAVLITPKGELLAQQCAQSPKKYPCIFEFVYLARPDSVMDGISVYEARLRMGRSLGEKIKTLIQGVTIDVVIPIPDTSRPIALQLASILGVPYREGFIKNRYIGRTFIMPGQAMRKKSVKQKLNAIGLEFKDKNVLLVDDSIVRGTTSREIVQMARDQGAKSVYFASAAPPVRYPNVYGIDMPSRRELLATGRTDEEIAREIGATAVFYQDVEDLIQAVQEGAQLDGVDASCFNGQYITGHITPEWLEALEMNSEPRSQSGSQMDLNFQREENG
ncbi:MAG: amidophosphoribosyltransferase, partial [Ferrovum sp.]|nr:amidophosphoribosyltransferase [Ferrovum sp.]